MAILAFQGQKLVRRLEVDGVCVTATGGQRVNAGPGEGFAVSRQLLALVGGALEVDVEGAAVQVRLPRAQPDEM